MLTAIIGGAGGGKSTALAYLKNKGYMTLSTDDLNRELLEDADYIASVAVICPKAVRLGNIDKKAFAKAIFSDPQIKLQTEAVAHPKIIKKMLETAKLHEDKHIFAEITAMKPEYACMFDDIWYVTASPEIRAARIKSRDGRSDEEIALLQSAQMSDKQFRDVATAVINSDEGLKSFYAEIEKLL